MKKLLFLPLLMFLSLAITTSASAGGGLIEHQLMLKAQCRILMALAGDLDRDNDIDLTDMTIMAQNWGGEGIGDLNFDGIVEDLDLEILLDNMGRNCFSN